MACYFLPLWSLVHFFKHKEDMDDVPLLNGGLHAYQVGQPYRPVDCVYVHVAWMPRRFAVGDFNSSSVDKFAVKCNGTFVSHEGCYCLSFISLAVVMDIAEISG